MTDGNQLFHITIHWALEKKRKKPQSSSLLWWQFWQNLFLPVKTYFCWHKVFLPVRFLPLKKRFFPPTGKNLPTLWVIKYCDSWLQNVPLYMVLVFIHFCRDTVVNFVTPLWAFIPLSVDTRSVKIHRKAREKSVTFYGPQCTSVYTRPKSITPVSP